MCLCILIVQRLKPVLVESCSVSVGEPIHRGESAFVREVGEYSVLDR